MVLLVSLQAELITVGQVTWQPSTSTPGSYTLSVQNNSDRIFRNGTVFFETLCCGTTGLATGPLAAGSLTFDQIIIPAGTNPVMVGYTANISENTVTVNGLEVRIYSPMFGLIAYPVDGEPETADIVLNGTVITPEPTTWALLLAGGIVVWWKRCGNSSFETVTRARMFRP